MLLWACLYRLYIKARERLLVDSEKTPLLLLMNCHDFEHEDVLYDSTQYFLKPIVVWVLAVS